MGPGAQALGSGKPKARMARVYDVIQISAAGAEISGKSGQGFALTEPAVRWGPTMWGRDGMEVGKRFQFLHIPNS